MGQGLRVGGGKFPLATLYVPPGLFNYLPGYSDFTPKGLGRATHLFFFFISLKPRVE